MKITKYLTFLLCLMIALVLTNEMKAQYYLRELSTNCWSFHFGNEIDREQLAIISDIAVAEKVTLYTWRDGDNKQGETFYRIYETGGLSEYLRYNLPQKSRSFLYGETIFTVNSLDELESVDENTYFRIKGDDNQIEKFVNSCESITNVCQLSVNALNYSKQCIIITNFVWSVIIIFTLLASIFYVSITKREKSISICYGKSKAVVIVGAMIAEFVFLTPLTLICVYIVNSVLLMQIRWTEVSYILILIIVSIIPYIMYASFNIKMISHENRQLIKVARLSKILKVILTTMTIISLVLSYNSLVNLIKLYNNNYSLQEFTEYSLLNIKMFDYSNVPDEIRSFDSALCQSYADRMVSNSIYENFYDNNNITIIEKEYCDDDNGAFDIIYCNGHSKHYISKYVNVDPASLEDNCIIYYIPDETNISEKRIHRMDTYLKNINHSDTPQPVIIKYQNEIDFNYFAADEDSLIGQSHSPYIIFDSTNPHYSPVNEYEDRRDMISLIIDPDENIISELNSIKGLEYSLYPIKDSISYAINKSKKAIISLSIIDFLLLVLETIMTINIIAFDYKLNGKEYCIKTILGYKRVKKYRNIFLFLLLIYIAISAILSLKLSTYTQCVCIASSSLCVIDFLIVTYFTVREEKKKTLVVLKSGY